MKQKHNIVLVLLSDDRMKFYVHADFLRSYYPNIKVTFKIFDSLCIALVEKINVCLSCVVHREFLHNFKLVSGLPLPHILGSRKQFGLIRSGNGWLYAIGSTFVKLLVYTILLLSSVLIGI